MARKKSEFNCFVALRHKTQPERGKKSLYEMIVLQRKIIKRLRNYKSFEIHITGLYVFAKQSGTAK